MTQQPVLAADERALFEQICPVSRETLERFETYRRLLAAWQAKTNLVAPGTLLNYWSRHIADSLQVKALFPEARRFVDLGSGAGFPGMVLALANSGLEGAEHHLVDSSQKKCGFLRVVAASTQTGARVHCERIELAARRLALLQPPPQIVTARALKPLPELLELALPLLEKGAVGLFHKGREYLAEIEECNGLWRFDLIVHASKVESGSVLLEIRNLVRTAGRG